MIIPLSQSCVLMLGVGLTSKYYEMPGTDGNMGRLSAYRDQDHEAALDAAAARARS